MRLLIPSARLRRLPQHLRLAHEYCFFLHDEMVRMLLEYERADASKVSVQFVDPEQSRRFEKLARKHHAITALRELGLHEEARRVVLNAITSALVSDCGHHIYEALMCFEKRKIVPGFNLLRKPLLDDLMYCSWIVGDEDGFYSAFTSGDPNKITLKLIGNHRREILAAAIEKTELVGVVTADALISILFDAASAEGLYGLFQHAVHLVTVSRIELKTTPENFNFIFKNPNDDDVYETLYGLLPTVLLYLVHLVVVLYDRVKPPDPGARRAFVFRSTNGYQYLHHELGPTKLAEAFAKALTPHFACDACKTPLKVTTYNAARLLFSDSFRCTKCGRKQPFPFSWIL